MRAPRQTGGRVFRAVDGTVVREPGKTGSAWRIHYMLRLSDLECDHFQITPARVKGGGESLSRLPVKPGDCLLADRGFCHSAGVLAQLPHFRAGENYFGCVCGHSDSTGGGSALCFQRAIFRPSLSWTEKPM